MAVSDNRVTFWFGCNMLRHAEMIRLSIMLLELAGYDVRAAGGPAYCRSTAHDHQPHGASNMAGRTVSRSTRPPRGWSRHCRDLVCLVPHAHVRHHGAGIQVAFDITHIPNCSSHQSIGWRHC